MQGLVDFLDNQKLLVGGNLGRNHRQQVVVRQVIAQIDKRVVALFGQDDGQVRIGYQAEAHETFAHELTGGLLFAQVEVKLIMGDKSMINQ